jgi:hypothetical protein
VDLLGTRSETLSLKQLGLSIALLLDKDPIQRSDPCGTGSETSVPEAAIFDKLHVRRSCSASVRC